MFGRRRRKHSHQQEVFQEFAGQYVLDTRMIEAARAVGIAEIHAHDQGEQVAVEADILVSEEGHPTPARMVVTDRHAMWVSIADLELVSFELRGLYTLVTDGEPSSYGLIPCMVSVVDRDSYDLVDDADVEQRDFLFFVPPNVLRIWERAGVDVGLLA